MKFRFVGQANQAGSESATPPELQGVSGVSIKFHKRERR
jgi:hypothetical protein